MILETTVSLVRRSSGKGLLKNWDIRLGTQTREVHTRFQEQYMRLLAGHSHSLLEKTHLGLS